MRRGRPTRSLELSPVDGYSPLVRSFFRARNLCRDCKATFEVPLGQDLALRCPACGSTATEVRSPGLLAPLVLGATAVAVLAIMGESGSRTERQGWWLHLVFETARHLLH